MKFCANERLIKLSKTDEYICKNFEYFLRKWCEVHQGEDTVYFTDDHGNLIFDAKLLD